MRSRCRSARSVRAGGRDEVGKRGPAVRGRLRFIGCTFKNAPQGYSEIDAVRREAPAGSNSAAAHVRIQFGLEANFHLPCPPPPFREAAPLGEFCSPNSFVPLLGREPPPTSAPIWIDRRLPSSHLSSEDLEV